MHKIKTLKKEDHKDLIELFEQLSGKPVKLDDFHIDQLINDPNCHCITIEYQ